MSIDTISSATTNSYSRYSGALDKSDRVQSTEITRVPIPDGISEMLSDRFVQLRDAWLRSIRYTNSMNEIAHNEHLGKIIGMGPAVIPFILRDLEAQPKHWFYALRALTGQNPIKKREAGNLRKMSESWLNWARNNGVKY